MLNSTKLLLTTAIVLTTLTACDKKEPANPEIATTSTTATTSVTKTETADSTTALASTSTVAGVVPATESNVTPTVTGMASTTTKTETKEMVTPPEPVAVISSTPNVKFPATQDKSKSIVTQAVKVGTPEATVKNMMDAMMTGTPQQVTSYYGVNDPIIVQALAEQQPIVQQQLAHLQLGTVEYNKDKTKAIMVGKLTFKDNTSKEVGYKLQKINGQWKLMP